MADKRVRYIIEFDTKSGEGQIKNLDGQIIKTANSAKQLNNEVRNLTSGADGKGGMQGLTTATGGASAAALELGRVVSDAPYGIRGMANNVSQLASNILFMSQQTNKATGATIGFMGAVGNMFKALKGPLGVLLAIQAVVAALDFFAGSTKKAEKATKSFNAIAGEAASNLKLLRIAINENLISQENLQKAINSANKEYKDLNLKTSENTALEIASKEALDDKIKSLEDLAKAQAILKAIEEDLGKLAELSLQSAKLEEEANKAELAAINAISDNYRENGTAALESAASTKRAAADANKNAIDALRDNIKKSVELIEKEGLWDRLFTGGDEKTRARRAKIFKQNLLDLEKQIIGFNKSRLLAEAQGEEESRRIRQKFERDELKRVRDAYIRKEKLRLDNYSKEQDAIINNENSTTAQVEQAEQNKLNAIRTFNNEKIQSQEQYNKASKALGNKHTAENAAADAALRDQKRLHDTEMQNLQAQMDAWVKENGIVVQKDLFDENQAKLEADKKYWEDKRDAAEEGSKEYLEAVKKAKQLEVNITNNAAEREKATEQAKFDFKIGIMAATSSALGSLSILAKEGSDLSKGLALTQIALDTATGFMAGLRIAQETAKATGPAAAFAMPLFYAQQVAAVLAAAAQAKRIISSGGSGSATSPSAGGGGGGGTTFRPDFNIVGASGQNQLAATVAGQVGEPTRAYVVYDDLRTAGEIEANAVEAAGI